MEANLGYLRCYLKQRKAKNWKKIRAKFLIFHQRGKHVGCSITVFSTVFSKMRSSHYRISCAGHTQSCDLNHVAYIILLMGNLLPALLPLTLQGGAIDLTSFLQQAELSLSRFHPHPHLRPSLGAPSSMCTPILQWVFSASWAIADMDIFIYKTDSHSHF